MTENIIQLLHARHPSPKYLCIEELRIGSGSGANERRIDFWALDCAPSRGNRAFAWEANPFVWALTFKVHECNVDKHLKEMVA